MKLTGMVLVLVLVAVLALVPALSALAAGKAFPEIIELPDGFRPEGIAVGRGHSFYVGSLANGAIYGGDLRTGQGEVIAAGVDGRITVGLAVDERSNYLFAGGGLGGVAYVFDLDDGELLKTYDLGVGFINDVVVTRDAAYFTNSFAPELYRVPLGPRGALPDQSAVETITLGGDFVFVPGPFVFNSNGIDATPDGKTLVVVNSTTQSLFKVDPQTGDATLIDVGQPVPNGDGLLLDGKTLYVMQNQLNQVAVFALDPDLSAGTLIATLTNDAFDVPTTIAEFGSDIYAVNARFSTPPTPQTEYKVVKVSKH